MKSAWKSVLYGTVSGLAGALVMHGFRIGWEKRASASPQSDIFGFDRESDINSVDSLCSALSLAPVPEADALKAALVLHYSFSAMAGVAYEFACQRLPQSSAGFGTLFGSTLWLLADEIAISVARLSDPVEKLPAAHLSALCAHLLFGGSVEVMRRTLGRVA